ncbi:PIG-L family deacetylase [Aureibaculum marinum]|uniref:PIG-L family deacetylase n=1 Tax=Aureibaculum marinum TaxID=2487930 RepID=A0A3N4NU74_9FLAO|nr:PIG-L family deacetylase [Aureibaculum marinum]RPD98237.1 PIG-L family deacetylase [Aureibaculum marinum]
MKKLVLIVGIGLLLFSCNIKSKSVKEEPKPITYTDKTIMAVFAHSDDESPISPVLSKYAKLGVNIYLVIVTDGSKGVAPHANIPEGDSLANVRAQEVLCTTKTLGINAPILLNYPDGELSKKENLFSLDDKIDSLFTTYRPDVVLTYGPGGSYGHPDHRAVSNIVTEVFQKNSNHTLKQLLYAGVLQEDLDAAPKLKTNMASWFKDNMKTTDRKYLTYRISYDADDLIVGRAALGCCKSQYTSEVMDEMFNLIGQREHVLYFRPWNGSDGIKTDIFE